jgi:LacI family transcriptional regulator
MKKKNLSIKEIAKLSNVSAATVSRVINNRGGFSDDTRENVLKVIKETGYEANNIAKSLRMSRSYSIGIIVPDIGNFFFADVVQKIEESLFEKKYSTIICNTARSTSKEKAYLKMLQSKMIDGLIVISGAEQFELENVKPDFPLICIDRMPKNPESTVFISSNHYQGAFEATELLLLKGCKNLCISFNRKTTSASKERLKGFKDALSKHNFSCNEKNNFLYLPDEKIDDKITVIKKYLKDNPDVDGIFAVNDNIALNLLKILPELGKKIPEDIKLIGFDNTPCADYCSPKLSSVKQDTLQISERAVHSLLDIINGKREQVNKYQLEPVQIILRESTN